MKKYDFLFPILHNIYVSKNTPCLLIVAKVSGLFYYTILLFLLYKEKVDFKQITASDSESEMSLLFRLQ